MRNRATVYALTAGAVFLLSSCAEPVEQAEPVEVEQAEPVEVEQAEPFDGTLDVLDNACDENANAFYLKVDGAWHFRPCDGCETVSVVTLWGGNTGGEQEIVEILEELSADLPNQEVPIFQLAQRMGDCP